MRKIFLIIALAFCFIAQAQTDSLFVTTSDSVQLFVKRSGHGTPVLFIHGGPGSNSAYFQYTGGNVFEKDVQMIYLDQRGCGSSSNATNKDYSLQRIVKDFEEVRKALGIQQWIIMPHSFGGILATEYAYRYPTAVKAMVYLNCTIDITSSANSGIQTALNLLPNMPAQDKAFLKNDSIKLLDRWFATFQMLDKEGIRYKLFFDSKEASAKHEAVTMQAAKHWDMQQHVFNYTEYFENFAPKTKSINVPVLIIGGTRDFTIGVNHPKLMQFPNQKIKYIAGGHALYMEHTQELYNAVSPFLKNYSL